MKVTLKIEMEIKYEYEEFEDNGMIYGLDYYLSELSYQQEEFSDLISNFDLKKTKITVKED